MSPLPGSPTGPLWKEVPVTRAFFYINFRVPRNGAPSRFPSQSANRERCSVHGALLQLSELPVNGPPMILNGAPVEKGDHLQSLLKSLVKKHPPKFPSGAPIVSNFHFRALLQYPSGSPEKEPSSKFP